MATEDHQVRHFDEELATLSERLLEMGRLARVRVGEAMRGLIERDAEALDAVIRGDAAVNALQIEIDDRCFKLIALYQPMASSLRLIVAGLKISGDLERVGDLAVNIAEASRRYIEHPPVKELVDLPRMGGIAQRMLQDALTTFVTHDLQLAQDVLRRDDELDALKNQIFRELLGHMLARPAVIKPATDLILISRHLERVGDHATNVAEDVIFLVEAKDVRHQPAGPA